MAYSRLFRIAALGAGAGLGGAAGRAYIADSFFGSTTGGAATALLMNAVPGLRFQNIFSIALLGGIAGVIADIATRRAFLQLDANPALLPVSASLVLAGTGIFGAVTAEKFFPNELQLIEGE